MSHELHHFTMGLWVFFLAYATSVVGSYVGLSCVRQSFKDDGKNARIRWLAMASLAIGGVGIWLMHFIGMMGFAVPGSTIRYALAPTLFSVVLAVGATLFGLWIVDSRAGWKTRVPRGVPLAVGGLVMGLAVSFMHYSGMAAIRIRARSSTIRLSWWPPSSSASSRPQPHCGWPVWRNVLLPGPLRP